MKLPDKSKVLDILIEFLANPANEGCKLVPYLDGGGVPTIGIGSTTYEDGTPVTMRDACITKPRAFAMAKKYAEKDFDWLAGKLAYSLNKFQYAATMSLLYNIGQPRFANSTVLRRLNMGDLKGAKEAFKMWNKDNGQVVRGLVGRRAREIELFEKGDLVA